MDASRLNMEDLIDTFKTRLQDENIEDSDSDLNDLINNIDHQTFKLLNEMDISLNEVKNENEDDNDYYNPDSKKSNESEHHRIIENIQNQINE